MKTTLLFLSVFLSVSLFGQYTQIPDPNFEQALIDLGYDSNLDGQVFTPIISQVTDLDLSSSGVTNLSGIEDFTSLVSLNISGTSLTSISEINNLPINQLSMINTPLLQNVNLSSLNLSSWQSFLFIGGMFFNSMNKFSALPDGSLNLRVEECTQSLNLNFDLYASTEIKVQISVNNSFSTLNLAGSNLKSITLSRGYDSGSSSYVSANIENLIIQDALDLSSVSVGGNYYDTDPIPLQSIQIVNSNNVEFFNLRSYSGSSIDFSVFYDLKQLYSAYNTANSIYDLSNCQSLQSFACNQSSAEQVKICSPAIDSVNVSNCNNLTCLTVKGVLPLYSESFRLYTINTPLLNCVEVENGDYFNAGPIGNGDWYYTQLDSDCSFSSNCDNSCSLNNCTLNIAELSPSKTLIQILDMMGRETSFKPNTPLIYVYDDGSIEKVFSVEY